MRHRRFFAALLPLALLFPTGCGKELPEPQSEGAQLYVRYCSGSGCHDPIPPGVDQMPYWRNQYTRMLELMQREGWPLPDREEEGKILRYIERHAYRPGS